MHHTASFVTPVMEHWLEREIAQWVHPMKDRSDDPSHPELTSYHRATSCSSVLRLTTLTYLLCRDLSVWSGVGAEVTVEEVSDRGRQVHQIHSLHVRLEDPLGCPAQQLANSDTLRIRAVYL